MTQNLRNLEGVIPAGYQGHCGDAAKCAIARWGKQTFGWQNPRIGIETMSFTLNDVRYTVRTPLPLRKLQHELDKQGADGTVETTAADTTFSVRLVGRNVTSKPIERMSDEAKARLKARKAAPGVRDRINAMDRQYQANLKARLS